MFELFIFYINTLKVFKDISVTLLLSDMHALDCWATALFPFICSKMNTLTKAIINEIYSEKMAIAKFHFLF